MRLTLPPLAYEKHALAPYISAQTLDIHYEHHHRGYLDKLEQTVAGTSRAGSSLDQLVSETDGEVFDLAAQVWNHTFYFDGMCRGGGGRPTTLLAATINRDHGSYERFCRSIAEAANEQFGSGWAWLALDKRGRLQTLATSDADNPLRHGMTPMLAIDVWEHAYYLDYRSERATYVATFLEHLVDWQAIARRFEKERMRRHRVTTHARIERAVVSESEAERDTDARSFEKPRTEAADRRREGPEPDQYEEGAAS
jgi:Fe-Mn family superoxide dismutase